MSRNDSFLEDIAQSGFQSHSHHSLLQGSGHHQTSGYAIGYHANGYILFLFEYYSLPSDTRTTLDNQTWQVREWNGISKSLGVPPPFDNIGNNTILYLVSWGASSF